MKECVAHWQWDRRGKVERANGSVDGRDCSSELEREWGGRRAVIKLI